MTARLSPAAGIRTECRFGLRSACKVGEVRTSYGALVFIVSYPCHHSPAEKTS